MRKLIVAAMTSLDGVIQAPGGPDEDTSGGFAHGGWIWPHAGGDGEVMGGVFSRPFALLLGRRTYDIFAAYWPEVPPGAPHGGLAARFNAARKHVATHRPGTLDWVGSHALGADVPAAVRALKHDDGPDLFTQGSSELVHQLLASDLVDELRLLVYPVVLGRGKRLFDAGSRAAAFRLASSSATSRGVLVTHYQRAGEVESRAFDPG
ncbi:MAG: dihydrofolate reductase family protein [Proteobacteria bacterium]|nr:dihydrofolate reductase family protein [Pseudomonadota bacterium]